MSQLERIQDYFSASAREWQDLYARPQRVNDLVLANRRKLAVEKVSALVAPGGRILDAGCGAGLVGLDLVERGFYVHGLDIAEPMLELARRRFAERGIAENRYAFTNGEMAATPFEPESFDAIIALGFLEYQEDEAALLRRFRQLLKPRAILVVSGPTEIRLANYLGVATKVRERLVALNWRKPKPGPYRIGLHRYSPSRFSNLLKSAGLELIDCQGHGFVEFEGPLRGLPYAGELVLHRTLSLLAKIAPIHRWGNDMIAVARKPAATGR